MFIYEPSLLMMGDWTTIATSCVAASIGIMAFAAGLQGYMLREARPWERVVLVVAAVLLIVPGYLTDVLGLVLLGIVAFVQKAPMAAGAAATERAK